MKICRKCGIKKIENDFNKSSHHKKDGLNPICRDCNLKISKVWKENNSELIKEINKNWRKNNKERRRQYNEKHKDELNIKRNLRRKKRKINNLLFKLSENIRKLIKQSIKNNKYTKTSKTYQLLGCTFQELMIHLGPQPSLDYHLDHICPCAQAQNEEEFMKLQHYTNFRWLSAFDNLSKSDSKTPEGEILCRVLLGREWIVP